MTAAGRRSCGVVVGFPEIGPKVLLSKDVLDPTGFDKDIRFFVKTRIIQVVVNPVVAGKKDGEREKLWGARIEACIVSEQAAVAGPIVDGRRTWLSVATNGKIIELARARNRKGTRLSVFRDMLNVPT